MLSLRAISLCAVLFLLMLGPGGCVQGDNHVDEDKDPHFQRGRNLVSGQDFKGAADEFEKALETNPRSAAAHFELGWLCDDKLKDYAAAIYHYQQHLKLQPDSPRAPLVKDRIRLCTQELANGEFALPRGRDLQKDVDRLNAENAQLRQQVEALKIQLANANALTAGRSEPVRYATAASSSAQPGTMRQASVSTASRGRIHVVQAHETISSIAAQYGLKANDVLAANPGTNPRRLRVGQSLNLP